jgi:hypothetical protein
VHLRDDLAEARSARANFTLLPRMAAYGTGGWRWVVDLARTTVVSGLIGYAALWLALAAGVHTAQLQAAAAYYVVAAWFVCSAG